MTRSQLRRQIAFEAAQLIHRRQESDYDRAKRKAARRLHRGRIKPAHLPSNAEICEQIRFLGQAYEGKLPRPVVDDDLSRGIGRPDRFQVYESLLWPLETVQQDPQRHPEGDALYHSLQVFERAREQLPYDEEFLLAALLHDVGKGLLGEERAEDHVAPALAALEGFISPRTAWLIQHHQLAHQIAQGTLGLRAIRRLRLHESFDELVLLCRCDREGRRSGVAVDSVDQALDYLRELERMCGG